MRSEEAERSVEFKQCEGDLWRVVSSILGRQRAEGDQRDVDRSGSEDPVDCFLHASPITQVENVGGDAACTSGPQVGGGPVQSLLITGNQPEVDASNRELPRCRSGDSRRRTEDGNNAHARPNLIDCAEAKTPTAP